MSVYKKRIVGGRVERERIRPLYSEAQAAYDVKADRLAHDVVDAFCAHVEEQFKHEVPIGFNKGDMVRFHLGERPPETPPCGHAWDGLDPDDPYGFTRFNGGVYSITRILPPSSPRQDVCPVCRAVSWTTFGRFRFYLGCPHIIDGEEYPGFWVADTEIEPAEIIEGNQPIKEGRWR